MTIPEKLTQLGHALPQIPKPVGAYLPAIITGNLLFISGQLPTIAGKLLAEGKVPTVVPIDLAQRAAAQCAINALAIAATELNGDWSRLTRVIRIGVFVQSDPDFKDHAKVANGASELLQQLMGDSGRHVRAAVGANSLPLNAPVEAEFLFQIQ
jgi:enamine deaminase RidA (YjgF/YER057c/UK114 family)